MTITHDQQERNTTYWDKQRLEKFWGRNPQQEFNDLHYGFNETQSEFQEVLGGVEQEPKSLSEMDVYDYSNRLGSPKKIRRFPSGAVRSDDTGRIRPDYISPYAIEEIAKHFTTAKNDFGPTNYFLGIKPVEIIPSVFRHYLELHSAYMEGDMEKVRHDFRSLAANCIMALHQIVLEEKGLYKEVYDKTELVNAEEYLKSLDNGKAY